MSDKHSSKKQEEERQPDDKKDPGQQASASKQNGQSDKASESYPENDSDDNGTAQHGETESGIGCSNLDYYNCLMSGQRMTRKRIKKPEEPTLVPQPPKKKEKLHAQPSRASEIAEQKILKDKEKRGFKKPGKIQPIQSEQKAQDTINQYPQNSESQLNSTSGKIKDSNNLNLKYYNKQKLDKKDEDFQKHQDKKSKTLQSGEESPSRLNIKQKPSASKQGQLSEDPPASQKPATNKRDMKASQKYDPAPSQDNALQKLALLRENAKQQVQAKLSQSQKDEDSPPKPQGNPLIDEDKKDRQSPNPRDPRPHFSKPVQQSSDQVHVRKVTLKQQSELSQAPHKKPSQRPDPQKPGKEPKGDLGQQKHHNPRQPSGDHQKGAQPQSSKKSQALNQKEPADAQEAERVQRHLEMTDKFEQHFPHYQFIQGRLILYGESYAEIESVDLSRTQANKGVGPSSYEKLQAQVKIYPDSPSISMQIKYFKYLSRVYTCDYDKIVSDDLSDDIAESFDEPINPQTKILIVQVIDSSNKYPYPSQRFSSEYPIKFYALGKDDFEDRLVLGDKPITFKQGQQIDILRDLHTFRDQPDDQVKWAYKQECLDFIKNESNIINQKLYDYNHIKMQKILVNESNINASLFTICLYDQFEEYHRAQPDYQETQRGKGVLLQVKRDPVTKATLLLFRQIQMRQQQRDKLEWIHLKRNNPNREFHIESEYYRGFVSLEYLKDLDNQYATGVKLRSKHITFVSHEHNLQQLKSLNLTDPHKLTSKEEFEQRQDPLMRTQSMPISYHSVTDKPCIQCNRIAQGKSINTCANCGDLWHQECLQSLYPHAQILSDSERLWRCPLCIRCTNCRSMVGNKNQILLCKSCNSPYHTECLEPSFKKQIDPSILSRKNQNLADVQFKCQSCVKCIQCGAHTAGPKGATWSLDFTLCGDCKQTGKLDLVQQESKDLRQIQCITCNKEMPVATCGDILFKSKKVTDYLLKSTYNCLKCRKRIRNMQIQNFICALDISLAQHFQSPPPFSKTKFGLKQPKSAQTLGYQIRQKYLKEERDMKDDLVELLDEFLTENGDSTNFAASKQQGHLKQQKMKEVVTQKCDKYFKDHLQRMIRAYKHESDFQLLLRAKQQDSQVPQELRAFEKDLSQIIKNMNNPQIQGQSMSIFIADEHVPQNFQIQQQQMNVYEKLIKNWSGAAKAPIQQQPSEDVKMQGPTQQPEDQPITQRASKKQQNLVAGQVGYQEQSSLDNIQINDDILKSKRITDAKVKGALDTSAASEFAVPLQKLVENESPEITHEIENQSLGGRKRQKRIDNYEQAAQNIQIQDDLASHCERRVGRPSSRSAAQEKYQTASVSGNTSHHVVQQNIFKDKNRKKMMEHYQREDDEGCYYSNPIRCSFDDPKLIFEEMCYMCGSFGNQGDFVTCILCSESFHTYCLQLTTNEIQEMFQSNWKCLNCKSCEVCGKATDEDKLCFCSRCDRPYHSFCLQPEIEHVPESWKCEHCFKCKSCGTNKYYNEADVAKGVNMTNSDYSLSQNFSLCFECGQNEDKKQSCSICFEKTTSEMHRRQETLKCQSCGMYSHISCSRVDKVKLKALMDEYNSKLAFDEPPLTSIEKVYKCLDCIVGGKSINFLILESCLHYEYIHNLIQRQKLLGDICVEILASYFPGKFREKAPLFIEKFISVNQDFFKYDSAILKWLQLMENEVYFDPHDYGQEPKIMSQKDSEELEEGQVRDIEMQDETIQLNKQQPNNNLDRSIQKIKANWRKFNPFEPSQYQQASNKRQSTSRKIMAAPETRAIQVEQEMYPHKHSLLPAKRSFYGSLYKGDLNRFAQSNPKDGSESLYINPKQIQDTLYNDDEKQKKLVDRLVNGIEDDEELSFEGSSSDDSDDSLMEGKSQAQNNTHSKTQVQSYVETELLAVMRIKQQFFKWFEQFFTKTMQTFMGNETSIVEGLTSVEKQLKIDSTNVEIIEPQTHPFDKSDSDSTNSVVSCIDDVPVENPQSQLTCLLCKQKGEFTVTGRLIPYKLNMYVHTSCALWTNECFDIDDGQILNFYQQQNKLIHQKCVFCGQQGATISCRRKGCNKHFHFPCAYRSGKYKFTKSNGVFCDTCNKSRGTGHNTSAVNASAQSNQNSKQIDNCSDDQDTNHFPNEYLKKKRLYIVNNFAEITLQEYENEYENQQVQEQVSQSKGNTGSRAKERNPEKDSSKRGAKESSRKNKEKDAGLASPQQNSQPGKEVEVDKWRPFYFDLFNRVGNLTVLSLRREVNQLIDILQKDSNSNGINNIMDYLKCSSTDDISRGANGRFRSPCEKAGAITLTGNMMEDFKRQQELFPDYATIRIYWKFYDDKGMSRPAKGNDDPRKLKRAYYLFLSKQKQIIEIDKSDIRTVMEFCSHPIRENFQVQANTSQCLNSQLAPRVIDQSEILREDFFWRRLMDHFKGQRSNFCLQNIEFCVEKLFGLAKYPISVWNQLELTTNDLRHNLISQKSKLSFFLKSALTVMTSNTYYSAILPGKPSDRTQAFQASQQKKEEAESDVTTLHKLLAGKQVSVDGVFRRMVKVNNMDRYDYDAITLGTWINGKFMSGKLNMGNALLPYRRADQRFNQMDQLSVNNFSSRHMVYKDQIIAQGKGTRIDTAELIDEQKTGKKKDKFSKKLNHNSSIRGQLQQAKKDISNAVQQQLAATSTNYSQQASNTSLPLATQYRKALQTPKKLEIGQSKIHRIGLFTQERLKEGDVLIEYVGEIIRHKVADIREAMYKEKGIGDCYMFRLDDQYVIDATFFGGKARYFNHSCQANCDAQTATINGQPHILIFAKKNIAEGEELTYNYQFGQDEDNEKLQCFCGAPGCNRTY